MTSAPEVIASSNEILPGLYDPGSPAATVGIGVHFAAGGVILALGNIQLIGWLRVRLPALHRWIGRAYVSAAILAGIGGLAFILIRGTIGGAVMNVGFGLYGALTVLCAVQAIRYARTKRFDAHRAWALRLFALAIGSWLYRMDYGFWFLLFGGAGHTDDFRGPFDQFMAFFFYAPNLFVVEAALRMARTNFSAFHKAVATGVFIVATAYLLVGTYYFTKFYWGPAILQRLLG